MFDTRSHECPSAEAYFFAKEKHQGQLYGDLPYTFHLHSVAHLVGLMYKGNPLIETLLSIAYLHDVMEDCGVTYEELAQKFGVCIAESVKAITKVEGESYEEYMAKVIASDLARKVKVCDTMSNLHNSFISGREKGMAKYPTQLAILHKGNPL